MDPRGRAKALAHSHLSRGDALGWFEELYQLADGDQAQIPWADLRPNCNLLAWLENKPRTFNRALVIGCGLGDDAEELAHRGFQTTAFDISPTAIKWCRRRFPKSAVDYQVADLLDPPPQWQRAFDLVVESYTLQVLPPDLRSRALAIAAEFVAPEGALLVICRGRNQGDAKGNMPWPLTREELEPLKSKGLLHELVFEDFLDDETPPVRRFRIEYVRQS